MPVSHAVTMPTISTRLFPIQYIWDTLLMRQGVWG
jgi:hypothetical protein